MDKPTCTFKEDQSNFWGIVKYLRNRKHISYGRSRDDWCVRNRGGYVFPLLSIAHQHIADDTDQFISTLAHRKTLIILRTDGIILQRLFIASTIASLSVFLIPLELLESEKDLKHNPESLWNSQPADSKWASERNKVPYESNYQVVFSTGCSVFQDWQSCVFFFHVLGKRLWIHFPQIVCVVRS